jgi:hypothetical protein
MVFVNDDRQTVTQNEFLKGNIDILALRIRSPREKRGQHNDESIPDSHCSSERVAHCISWQFGNRSAHPK